MQTFRLRSIPRPSALLAVTALAGLVSCAGSDGSPDTPPPAGTLQLARLACGPGDALLVPPRAAGAEEVADVVPGAAVGEELCFRAFELRTDGSVRDRTSEAGWEVEPAGVADVRAPGRLAGRRAGAATVRATVAAVGSGEAGTEPGAAGSTPIRIVGEAGVTYVSAAPDDWVERRGWGFVWWGGGPGPLPLGSAHPASLSCLPTPVDVPPSDGGGTEPGGGESGGGDDGSSGDDPVASPPPVEPPPVDGGGTAPVDFAPCFSGRLVFVGDALPFQAVGFTDVGGQVVLTEDVEWTSSDADVLAIAADGRATARKTGAADVVARYRGLESPPYRVTVTAASPTSFLVVEREIPSSVLEVGGSDQLHVVAFYENGATREVTSDATLVATPLGHARILPSGRIEGRSPGRIEVNARHDGLDAVPALGIEVWQSGRLDFCDAAQPNRAEWTDQLNRVHLTSDCARYSVAGDGAAQLLYSVYEIVPQPGRPFTPCLDLRVLDDAGRIVRTLRRDGCDVPVPIAEDAAAPGAEPLLYEWREDWDLRADDGTPVAPGAYVVQGVFFLYYDPVIELPIELLP